MTDIYRRSRAHRRRILSGLVYDLYVDYKNGNDTTGDGTSNNPYKTIAKIITVASDGDTIGVRGDAADKDTYFREDNLTISVDNITLIADVGHTPVWVASEELTSWSKTGGQTNVYEATFAGSANTGAYNETQVLEPVADVATVDATTNSFYWNANTLYVNIGGDQPTSIEAIVGVNWLATISADGVTIDGIDFQWMFPTFLCSGDDGTLKNYTVQYQGWEQATAHLLTRIQGSGWTIESCTFTGLGRTHDQVTDNLEILNTAANATVTRCTFTDAKDGIEIAGGTGHVVEYNTIKRSQRYGLVVSGAGTGVTARYNTIRDCASAHVYTHTSFTGTLTFHHNLVYLSSTDDPDNDSLSGTRDGMLNQGPATLNVYHNVFANLEIDATTADGVNVGCLSGTLTITMKNNVFLDIDKAVLKLDIGGTVSMDFDNNSFYGNTTDYQNVDPGDQGANDITSDPLFTDAPNNDYTLTGSSPCIDAGVAVVGINEGHLGDAPDIGRYETA